VAVDDDRGRIETGGDSSHVVHVVKMDNVGAPFSQDSSHLVGRLPFCRQTTAIERRHMISARHELGVTFGIHVGLLVPLIRQERS
jgi:hypothetical protein